MVLAEDTVVENWQGMYDDSLFELGHVVLVCIIMTRTIHPC